MKPSRNMNNTTRSYNTIPHYTAWYGGNHISKTPAIGHLITCCPCGCHMYGRIPFRCHLDYQIAHMEVSLDFLSTFYILFNDNVEKKCN